MNMQIPNPKDEIRRRSAELHSAVSQICNLRRIGRGQRVGPVRHAAEYNSAIRQIENLRYFGGGSPRHALLDLQSSGAEHRCAFTGLFTELHSISISENRRTSRRFFWSATASAYCCNSGISVLVAASPRCAVSQICNLRRVGKGQRVGPVRHAAEYNSAIKQIENLRYDVSRLSRAGQPPSASFGFRVSDFLRNSDFRLRILRFCHT